MHENHIWSWPRFWRSLKVIKGHAQGGSTSTNHLQDVKMLWGKFHAFIIKCTIDWLIRCTTGDQSRFSLVDRQNDDSSGTCNCLCDQTSDMALRRRARQTCCSCCSQNVMTHAVYIPRQGSTHARDQKDQSMGPKGCRGVQNNQRKGGGGSKQRAKGRKWNGKAQKDAEGANVIRGPDGISFGSFLLETSWKCVFRSLWRWYVLYLYWDILLAVAMLQVHAMLDVNVPVVIVSGIFSLLVIETNSARGSRVGMSLD